MSLINPIATALSKVFNAGARPAAELAFSQMQNSLIGRLNTEIQKVNDRRGDVAREHALKRENQLLGTQIDLAQKYAFDNQSNRGKLEEASDIVFSLSSAFAADGNALDVTAQEATDFGVYRDALVDKINSLRVLSYPNAANDGRIRDLLDQVDTLKALTPDVGAVDPEGTENPNNNRVIVDYMTEIANKVSVAITVTDDTVYLGHQMAEVATKKYFGNEAELLKLTEVDQKARTQEIEDMKVQYANLLKAISLSYEASLSYSDSLSKNLNGTNAPAAGSVLNLFS